MKTTFRIANPSVSPTPTDDVCQGIGDGLDGLLPEKTKEVINVSSTRRIKRQRLRMWKEDPRCRFCGQVTVLPPDKRKQKAQDNWATIEHLRSRLDPNRGEKPKQGEVRRVLCCWRCNNDRNNQELIEKIDIQRQRSNKNIHPEPPFVSILKKAYRESGLPEKGKRPKKVRKLQTDFIKRTIGYDEFVEFLKMYVKKQIISQNASPSKSF